MILFRNNGFIYICQLVKTIFDIVVDRRDVIVNEEIGYGAHTMFLF